MDQIKYKSLEGLLGLGTNVSWYKLWLTIIEACQAVYLKRLSLRLYIFANLKIKILWSRKKFYFDFIS